MSSTGSTNGAFTKKLVSLIFFASKSSTSFLLQIWHILETYFLLTSCFDYELNIKINLILTINITKLNSIEWYTSTHLLRINVNI